MKTRALVLSAALAAAAASTAAPAHAQVNANIEATKTCFADNTDGKDRKMLSKWVFLAMAAHPEIATLSAATPAQIEQSNRDLAALFMRLVTQDCQPQMRTMINAEGADSIKVAFEYLGQIAMAELMSHQSVTGRIGEFEPFIDQEKLRAAISP